VRYPDVITLDDSVGITQGTKTDMAKAYKAQMKWTVFTKKPLQLPIDGVRLSRQHWHSNPLSLAGRYQSDATDANWKKYFQEAGPPTARVTNQQLINTMIIQSRDWICEALAQLTDLPEAGEARGAKIKKFFTKLAYSLHMIQDSYSRAHTARDESSFGDTQPADQWIEKWAKASVVQFYSMDYADFPVHADVDNVPETDVMRSCAAAASKAFIETVMKPLAAAPTVNDEVKSAILTAVVDLFRSQIFPMAEAKLANGAGGNRLPLSGKSPKGKKAGTVNLPAEDGGALAVVTPQELSTYILDYIRKTNADISGAPQFKYATDSRAGFAGDAFFPGDYIGSPGFLTCAPRTQAEVKEAEARPAENEEGTDDGTPGEDPAKVEGEVAAS